MPNAARLVLLSLLAATPTFAAERGRRHWAFVPPESPPPPKVADPAWPHNPIDSFIQARLNRKGLLPSPAADKARLIRRVALDLTGLPPTPEQVDAFLADGSADAYGRLVDRLLASPRFGEHMARFWLDAARYGDTHGLHLDNYREMWAYRDWVVAAYNANKPFDEFAVEQLAGDLLPDPSLDQLIATGFLRCNVTTNEGGSIAEEVYVRNVVDRVDTNGTVFLGLTVGCARCHDHKYDPVSQKEYYQLFAYFNNIDGRAMDGNKKLHPPGVLLPDARRLGEIYRAGAKVVAAAAALKRADGGQKAGLQKRLKALRGQKNRLLNSTPSTLIYRERRSPRQAYRLDRGEYTLKAEKVGRSLPAFLPPLPDGAPNDRLGFARWLVRGDHPLTARVTVNRLWQRVFGTGLVKTSEDFGRQGERPSHPELLDWLAVEFRDSGWDVKRFMRLLVTSAAYRQSSRVTSDRLAADPQNRLLSRGPRFRLDAETLRDQALAAGGLLVERLGGPGVKPPQPDGLWHAVGYTRSNTARFKADEGREKVHRRSVYTFWKRTAPPPQMGTFDAPTREATCVRRERTNTPLQALLLLNDPQYVEAAVALAARAAGEVGPDSEGRVRRMFRLTVCRVPSAGELGELVAAYGRLRKIYDADPAAAAAFLKTVGVTAERPAELAALAMVGNILLNYDEVLNKG